MQRTKSKMQGVILVDGRQLFFENEDWREGIVFHVAETHGVTILKARMRAVAMFAILGSN